MTLSAGWLNILSGFVLHDLNSSFVSRKMRNIALHLDDLKTLIRPQTKINHVIIRKKFRLLKKKFAQNFVWPTTGLNLFRCVLEKRGVCWLIAVSSISVCGAPTRYSLTDLLLAGYGLQQGVLGLLIIAASINRDWWCHKQIPYIRTACKYQYRLTREFQNLGWSTVGSESAEH